MAAQSTATMACERSALLALPQEVQIHIFSFVTAEDLGRWDWPAVRLRQPLVNGELLYTISPLRRLCCVCRNLHGLVRGCAALWRAQCRRVWLCTW